MSDNENRVEAGIQRRRKGFLAFLLAFVLAFTHLGTAMVMAGVPKLVETADGTNFESEVNGKIIQPSEELDWELFDSSTTPYKGFIIRTVTYYDYIADFNGNFGGYDDYRLSTDEPGEPPYTIRGYEELNGSRTQNFGGWKIYGKPEKGSSGGWGIDICLVATEKVRYTVSFNSNGGTEVKPQTVEKGQKVTEPDPAPTKEGSTFKGWYKYEPAADAGSADKLPTNEELTELYDFNEPVEKDMILYAKWEENKKEPSENKTPGGRPIRFDETGKLFQVMIIERKDNSLVISWNKVPDADGYFVFGRKCYVFPLKLIADIDDPNTLTFEQTGLRKGTYYKYQIRAYKIIQKGNRKKKKVFKRTLIVHGNTTPSSKFTVAEGVDILSVNVRNKDAGKVVYTTTPSGNFITMEVDTKARIVGEEKLEEEGKKIDRHRGCAGEIQYQSNDETVAKVSKRGRIMAQKKEGHCTIFAGAQNGRLTAIDVTVVKQDTVPK